MTAPNHIAGGIVITGLFGSFLGVNLLASPYYIATAVLAAQLPDIDHTKSIIGRICYPIAKVLNRRYGHRTITHSFAALILLTAIVAATTEGAYSTIFFLAYASHLVLDMLTIQGIPLFYPIARNPCVIPGDPNLRFRSGDLRSETMAFFFFLAMGIFLQPLMKTGFWTQYNRLFGTTKHLASEFKKSDDLLLVHYEARKGSQAITGEGYVLDAKEGRVVLLENEEFKILDKKELVIDKVLPEHTNQQFFFDTKHFVSVSEDSLNLLLLDKLIWEVEIHSNNEFEVWNEDFQQAPMKQFKGEQSTNLFINEAATNAVTLKTYTAVANPRIVILREKLQRMQERDRQNQIAYSQLQDRISSIQQQITSTEDLVQRELWYEELKELKKEKSPTNYSNQIADLQAQIRELKKMDQLKQEAGRREVEQKNKEADLAPTQFTGYVTTIRIEAKKEE